MTFEEWWTGSGIPGVNSNYDVARRAWENSEGWALADRRDALYFARAKMARMRKELRRLNRVLEAMGRGRRPSSDTRAAIVAAYKKGLADASMVHEETAT